MAQRVADVFAAIVVAALAALPAAAQQGGQVATPPPAARPAGEPAKVLAAGDEAPTLAGVSWLKGEPVKAFEKGRCYVVEIWATWCGPCRQSIPHLTELQAKHKDKLTVIGISCWERADTLEERIGVAREFAEKQGALMDYTVGADGRGFIVRNWMDPSGRRSIPTAFIVDGTGSVAWIGNPLSGIEEVLEKVLAGGFDAKAEAQKARIAAASKQQKDDLFARANLLAQQNKHAEAMALMDEVLGLETEPAARVPMLRQKLRMLLKSDEPAAYVFARSLLEGELKDNDFGLYSLASAILMMPDLKAPDYSLAVMLAARSAELAAPGNAAVHETLAQAKFRAGDAAGAIAAAEKAIEIMNTPGYKGTALALARVQKSLEEYRASAKTEKK